MKPEQLQHWRDELAIQRLSTHRMLLKFLHPATDKENMSLYRLAVLSPCIAEDLLVMLQRQDCKGVRGDDGKKLAMGSVSPTAG